MGDVAGSGLQVIGAGFGRTGTYSLRQALNELGFGPTYHGQDIVLPHRSNRWARVARGLPVDWNKIFKGFHSAVDFPVCCVWRDLAAQYPEAKIILTVRDPGQWWESAQATLYPALEVLPAYMRRYLPWVRSYIEWQDTLVWDGLFEGRFLDREHAIKVFEHHVEDVKATADPDRLLVFDVAEGWEPLCAFLGVPVPDHPFPRTNSRADMQRLIETLRIGSRVLPPLAVGGALLAAARLARRSAR